MLFLLDIQRRCYSQPSHPPTVPPIVSYNIISVTIIIIVHGLYTRILYKWPLCRSSPREWHHTTVTGNRLYRKHPDIILLWKKNVKKKKKLWKKNSQPHTQFLTYYYHYIIILYRYYIITHTTSYIHVYHEEYLCIAFTYIIYIYTLRRVRNNLIITIIITTAERYYCLSLCCDTKQPAISRVRRPRRRGIPDHRRGLLSNIIWLVIRCMACEDGKKNKTTNKIQPCARIIIIVIIVIVDFTLHAIVSPSLRCPRHRGSCPCVSSTRNCHDNFTLLYNIILRENSRANAMHFHDFSTPQISMLIFIYLKGLTTLRVQYNVEM